MDSLYWWVIVISGAIFNGVMTAVLIWVGTQFSDNPLVYYAFPLGFAAIEILILSIIVHHQS